jgi:hypothetical protein
VSPHIPTQATIVNFPVYNIRKIIVQGYMLHVFQQIAKKVDSTRIRSNCDLCLKTGIIFLIMKNYVSVGLSILLLAGIVIGAARAVRVFYTSIQTYRSPLRDVQLEPQPATSPQTGKVVIVVLSGLGYDDSVALALPVLEQLKQAGATAAMASIPPTYSQTAWATLLSGAPPDTNDAPPFDRSLDALYPLQVDTIFARAHDAGLQTALLGAPAWRRLIPRNHLDHTFFVDQPGPQADQAILEAAQTVIGDDEIELVLIQFTQLDVIAERFGGLSSQAYGQTALTLDTYLGLISTALDLSQSALIVLAEHGHIPDGGHGGNEVEIIWQPLMMIGEGIIAGSYSDIHQIDIAPTVSTLLGLPVPTLAQGRILFEMLDMTEADQTRAQLLLAHQRTALAEPYLSYIQGSETTLPSQISADLAQAETALANNNIRGAFQLARLAQREADAHLALTRFSRTNAEQWPRLAAAGLILIIWFVTMWRRRGFHAGSIILAAIATLGLYHGLFQLQGHHYSLSSINDFSDMPFDIVRRTAVSLLVGGGLVLIFLMLTNEKNWLTLLGTGYGFGVLVTFVFALPFFWAYWQDGLAVSWRLPAVLPAYWQITSLFELITSASLGLLLPWPIMILNLLVNLIRHRLSQSRPQAEPDALPGLHL